MKTVGLYDAKSKLSALIAEIEAGGEKIQISKHGKVVAELCPPTAVTPTRGCLKSKSFHMAEDFDAPEAGFEDFFTDSNTTGKQLIVAEENHHYSNND